MGFWDFYAKIQKWFEKALDNLWLYQAVLVVGIIAIAFIVGGFLYLVISAKNAANEAPPDPDKVFIEQNALQFCMDKGFNGWQFKNNTVKQFECIMVQNETQSIEKFLNMT